MPPLGMTQLQLMQMVPLGGKLGWPGRVAGAQADATSERAEDLVWDATQPDCDGVLRPLRNRPAAWRRTRDAARCSRPSPDTAESMYRVGEGRQADVLRAQVEIAKMVGGHAAHAGHARDHGGTPECAARTAARQTSIGAPCFGPRSPTPMPDHGWLDSVAANGRPMIRAGLKDAQAADAIGSSSREKRSFPTSRSACSTASAMRRPPSRRQIGGTTERMGSLMIGASIPVFARDRQLRCATRPTR